MRFPGSDRVLRAGHDVVHALGKHLEYYGAVRPGTRTADGFGSFGDASLLNYPVGTLFGTRSMHVGSETLIGRHCTLSVGYGPDDPNIPERGLVIGDRCVIGAGAVLTAHRGIHIGDDVWFGNDVFVSDAGHGYQDPNTPIGRQLGLPSEVSIGDGSWIGHGAIVLPGATIGCQVVVGAGSVVRGVVPDHAVVAGVPARVVREFDAHSGWVAASDSGNIRPVWMPEDVARYLAGG